MALNRVLPLAVLLTVACESVAPQAQKVRVTSVDADVAQCTMLGSVMSHPPYIGPNDGVNQLRNQAAVLGADTLYLTSHGLTRGKNGVAYRCAAATVK